MLYDTDGPVATMTLNRPERLNTIVPPMPDEFEAAVRDATLDPGVKVIVLRGAGRSFCAGYDFGGGFHHWDDSLTTDGRWDPGKDFALAASPYGPTQQFMSIWRTPKPVIAQVHGWCVGGGSDMALCADLIIASEDAQIGTPYSRIWGCYLSGMWLYRLGPDQGQGARAHRQAAVGPRGRRHRVDQRGGAVRLSSRPTVARQAEQLASLPLSQLAAMKLVVNQAYENMGLRATQTLGPILDGLMREHPDAHAFIDKATARRGQGRHRGTDGYFGTTARQAPAAGPIPGMRSPRAQRRIASSISTSASSWVQPWIDAK